MATHPTRPSIPVTTTPGDPAAARLRRTLLFACLGYGYIAGILLLLIGVAFGLARAGMAHFAGLVLSLLVFVVWTLFIGIPPPEGVEVTRAQCPELHRAAERARAQLGAPPLDGVFVTEELNAGVLERPRFGILGRTQRYLCIGLPLLHALPAPEVRGILAHEFAHLSRQHGRAIRLLIRAHVTWQNLAFGLQSSRSWLAFLFVPFFRWYTPRLESRTQAIRREHEFESDRLAARAVGAETMGRALVRLHLRQRQLDREILPSLFRESRERDSPPEDGFGRVLAALERPTGAGDGAEIRAVLRDHTLGDHSHPSLRDRLAALRLPVEVAEVAAWMEGPAEPAAAAVLVGAARPSLTRRLGAGWMEQVRAAWDRHHTDARIWREKEAGAGAEEDAAALWARARWAAGCEPPATAIALLRQVLEGEPAPAGAGVLLGTLLLDEDDPGGWAEGVWLLEGESWGESPAALQATMTLRAFYARTGDREGEDRCTVRERELHHALLGTVRERGTLGAHDTIRPYPLHPVVRSAFLDALRGQREVKRAYLVQKQTRHLREAPMVVLAIELRVPWYRLTSGDYAQKVCAALLPQLNPGEAVDLLILPVERGTGLLRRLRGVPGAEIYHRDGREAVAVAAGEWSRPGRVRAVLRPSYLLLALFLALTVGGTLGRSKAEVPTAAQWEERLPRLQARVQADPSDARAQRRLARALMALERWEEAMPVLAEAVRLNPTDSGLHNNWGWVLLNQGRFEESLAPLRQSIHLDPGHAHSHHSLGWSLYRLGRLEEAERSYGEAIRLDPDVAGTHEELGWVLLDQHRLDESDRSFREAIRLDSTRAWAYNGLGVALVRRSRTDEAMRAFQRASLLAPRVAARVGGHRDPGPHDRGLPDLGTRLRAGPPPGSGVLPAERAPAAAVGGVPCGAAVRPVRPGTPRTPAHPDDEARCSPGRGGPPYGRRVPVLLHGSQGQHLRHLPGRGA